MAWISEEADSRLKHARCLHLSVGVSFTTFRHGRSRCLLLEAKTTLESQLLLQISFQVTMGGSTPLILKVHFLYETKFFLLFLYQWKPQKFSKGIVILWCNLSSRISPKHTCNWSVTCLLPFSSRFSASCPKKAYLYCLLRPSFLLYQAKTYFFSDTA